MSISAESKRLRKFRKYIGLNQSQLAYALDSKQTIISKYESGALNIPIDVVKALRVQFNLNYDWFFHGVGKMKTDTVERTTITTDLKNIILDNETIKSKVEKLDRDLKKLHFYVHDKLNP